jgi:SecD/SecF fusion protein
MLNRNLWKLILCTLLTAWAVVTLLPVKDTPFDQFARAEAGAKQTEFNALIDKARARFTSGQAPSVFMALKQIAREEKIDLSQFFPQIRLEENLRNVEKRNAILLDELLRLSKGRLQLGLDLKGGVAFTLEVD